MRPFISANLGLAPFALFWTLLPLAGPAVAIGAALTASLTVVAWRFGSEEWRAIEWGGAVIFTFLGAVWLVAPARVGMIALCFSFAGLGALALLTVAFGKPWTADYARAVFAAEAESPIFLRVNMLISGLWGGLFLVDAILVASGAGALATTALFALGALVSILGPRFMIRAEIARQIAAAEPYPWPAPKFTGSSDTDGFDVAVVGAGIGGLTAAALLADAGLKVVLHEAHVVPGGYCHCFIRKARYQGRSCLYRFDAGPHDFSGLFPGGPVTRVLERLGVADRIEWRRLDHTYLTPGERPIEPSRDWREYARELARQFPADAAGLQALFEDIKAIYDGMYATAENNCGIPGLPPDIDAMLAFPRAHPLAVRWMDRPFAELVASRVAGEATRRALGSLTGYMSDGREVLTCAQMVPLFGYYFHGGFYPVGGSGRLAEALVEAIEARGGRVHVKSRVERIRVENGRAAGLVLSDGTRVNARAVVCNADAKRAFGELVDTRELPADLRARIAGAAPAPSAMMVHLGVDYVPEGRPVIHVRGDHSVGVEILSKVDPSAAPDGHSTIGIVKLITHEEAKSWFSGNDDEATAERSSPLYSARKREMGDAMIAAAEVALPGLSRHIVYRSEASPITYARYDLATAGAIYGVSGPGRLGGVKSPIPGLVMAGAATHGPGVELVVISGARAAEALAPGLLARANAFKVVALAEV